MSSVKLALDVVPVAGSYQQPANYQPTVTPPPTRRSVASGGAPWDIATSGHSTLAAALSLDATQRRRPRLGFDEEPLSRLFHPKTHSYRSRAPRPLAGPPAYTPCLYHCTQSTRTGRHSGPRRSYEPNRAPDPASARGGRLVLKSCCVSPACNAELRITLWISSVRPSFRR